MNLYATKKRDESIDILKGLLIFFLVVHHANDWGYHGLGINCDALQLILIIQRPLILCYFMQAFFLVTGICSNYNKPIKEFLLNQVKQLLIPAIIFSLLLRVMSGVDEFSANDAIHILARGGEFWFLTAMFLGKIIYYLMNKFIQNKKIVLAVLLLLSFCGTLLNELDMIKNYYWHRQIFDLTLFIAVGNLFKDKIVGKKIGIVCLSVYVVTCITCLFIYGSDIPYVTAGFGTSIDSWIFHVILAFCGSVAVLNICKQIKNSKILEYMGRQSLVVYIFHVYFLKILFRGFSSLLENGTGNSFLYVAVIIVSTLGNCLLVAYILENTKLKILLGRS